MKRSTQKGINKFLKSAISTILITSIFICCFTINSNAVIDRVGADEVKSLGFKTLPDGYTYDGNISVKTRVRLPDNSDTGYYEDGKEIILGTCETTVVFASKSLGRGKYVRLALIRSSMMPEKTLITNGKYKNCYVQGINDSTCVSMKLDRPVNLKYASLRTCLSGLKTTFQKGVNLPNSSDNMPDETQTDSISAGITGDTSGNIGFNLNTGYSSATKKRCVEYGSNFYDSKKLFEVKYDFQIDSSAFFEAGKARNRWCTQTYDCYCVYSFIEYSPFLNLATFAGGSFFDTFFTAFFGKDRSCWFADFDISASFACAISKDKYWTGNSTDIGNSHLNFGHMLFKCNTQTDGYNMDLCESY